MDQQHRSYIVPDELKPRKEELDTKLRKFTKIMYISGIVLLILIILNIYFGIMKLTDTEQDALKVDIQQLQKENNQILQLNNRLQEQINNISSINAVLQNQVSNINMDIIVCNQKIQDLNYEISQYCDNSHQRLRFGSTGLSSFQISSTNIANSQRSIVQLNISFNHLSQFCGNNLSDLQGLDLSSNPITKIQKNKMNNLTSFQLINISQLQYFQQNSLLKLDDLNLSLAKIKLINNNDLPNLKTLHLNVNNSILQSVYGNNFGLINSIQIGSNNQLIIFENNTFSNLKDIQLSECIYNYSTFITNSISSLIKLSILNCLLLNYQYFNTMNSIQQLILQNTDITEMIHHNYPSLTLLKLIHNTKLQTFSNNLFPLLNELIITNASNLKDICHNSMPSVSYLTIQSTDLTNFTYCSANMKRLTKIQLLNNSIQYFQNMILTNLTLLTIQGYPLKSFKNNKFPALKYVKIQIDTSFDFGNFEQIQQIQLTGNLINLNNYQFLNLKKLMISSLSLTKQFKYNRFPNLQELYLNYVSIESLDSNDLKSLKKLVIQNENNILFVPNNSLSIKQLSISNSSIQQFGFKNLSSLQTLLITNSPQFYAFYTNNLPKLKNLTLTNNSPNFNVFYCEGIQTVEYLNLSGNKIGQWIVTRLNTCNLRNLKHLIILDNDIPQYDRQKCINELKDKFPNAIIQI